MDEANISSAEFHHCLQSLEAINIMTLAYRPTLSFFKKLFKISKNKVFTVLDVGCGGGDMLRAISKISSKQEGPVELTGIDLNPYSKQYAELSSPGHIRYINGDLFKIDPQTKYDLITCSLFTHHLTDEQLIKFLQWLDTHAVQGWIINDLHRHWLPFYFIKFTTWLFSRNRLIRNDAAVSVARSFTRKDWQSLSNSSGVMKDVKIEWFFPFRLCVSCQKV